MTKIEFLGAAQCVTGSKIKVTSNNVNVMMDCGASQGNPATSYLKNRAFDNNTPEIDYVLLSHAHHDHSGLLPNLVKRGYQGKIYATPPTFDLCRHMLKDSAEVSLKEVPLIRKMLKKMGDNTLVYPLYSNEDVDHCMNQFFPVKYDTEFKLNSKMSFSFHDSCHILGSASIKLNVEDNNINHRIWYTSDIGHKTQILSNEPSIPQDIDYLIIESTYGNKKRQETDVYQAVINHVNDAYARGGKVLIPVFSVGRMQTLILILHKLHIMGLIPNINIYVDSPLGLKATSIYEKYSNEIKQETMDFFKHVRKDAFQDTMIRYITSSEESEALMNSDTPCIILSSAGMMQGGKIREHAKHIVEDKKSTVLFVGYNAIETLGRNLEQNNGEVTIDGEKFRVRCKVEKIDGFSSHGDLEFLISYIEGEVASNAIKQIFLVHGEPDACSNIKHILKQKGITNVVIPELGTQYKL